MSRDVPCDVPLRPVAKPAATEAELVMDSLVGRDDFGLSELQREALHTRLKALDGDMKAHSISFTAADTWSGPMKCCDLPMIKLNGHKAPHEQFERCKAPACTRVICTHCGEMK